MAGASMVMPGMKLDGASIYELLNAFKVTCTAAVPTVWLALLAHLEATGGTLPHLKRVVIGGSACPRAMTQKFQDVYGVQVIHAWGMTEMSPLGSACSLKPEYAGLTGEARLDIQQKQGHPPFLVEMTIEDDAGQRGALGRQVVRPPQGARARRCASAISRATAATSSTRTATSIPATSPPWTATAICRSPTAPRT